MKPSFVSVYLLQNMRLPLFFFFFFFKRESITTGLLVYTFSKKLKTMEVRKQATPLSGGVFGGVKVLKHEL